MTSQACRTISHCVAYLEYFTESAMAATPASFHPKSFLVNKECLPTYMPVREEEQVLSLQFICSQQDACKRRRKKRKQVDDGTAKDYSLLKTL